jgi:hypothetical protein
MNLDLSEEATEFGQAALRALGAAGGDELVQIAEREPKRRELVVAPVLTELGAWDLDPYSSADELEAAAALCRAAGWWAIAYPVAERLSRPTDLDADGLVVVADVGPAGPVADLEARWATVTLSGRRGLATAQPATRPPRYSAFVTGLDVEPVDVEPVDVEPVDVAPGRVGAVAGGPGGAGAANLALGLTLPCWTLLGMLDRAMALARDHVLAREQFGQPLARFQGVQFQLTDAEVERAGLAELARYALWSVQTHRPEAVDDALALRVAAIEAAETVLRVAHQLHGAMGFCDETTLSWVSRYSQPIRRLPTGLSATQDELTRRVGRRGLTGLFPDAGLFSDVPSAEPGDRPDGL